MKAAVQRHHIYFFNLSSKQFSALLPVFLEKAQIQFGLSSGQRFSKTASETAVFLRREIHVQKKNKVE